MLVVYYKIEYNANVDYCCSGFLYHPDSQKILLRQDLTDPKPSWTLLEGSEGEAFQQTVANLLGFKLKKHRIQPVYDYISKGKKRLVSYAEIDKIRDFPPQKTLSFGWFTIKEISKLPLPPQVKQDIIVGFRVIGSSDRKAAGEQTIG